MRGGGWRWVEVGGGGWRWVEVGGGGWRWVEVGRGDKPIHLYIDTIHAERRIPKIILMIHVDKPQNFPLCKINRKLIVSR